MYSGKCSEVVAYFEAMGYSCPKFVDIADFLQELPTAEGSRFINPDFMRTSRDDLENLTSTLLSSIFFAYIWIKRQSYIN